MNKINPRWGNKGRNEKADAIFSTLISIFGNGIKDLDWLDIGCGSGGIAAQISTKVRAIEGIDPESWPQWEDLKEEQENLTLRQGYFDQESLPVPENSFDIIICNQVYEHVRNPKQLILNICKALKPGGVCYFAGPNFLWPIEPHVFWPFVHWLPRKFSQKLISVFNKSAKLDANSKNLWQLKKYFKESGLTYEDIIPQRLAFRCNSLLRYRSALKLISIAMLPITPGFVFLLKKENNI